MLDLNFTFTEKLWLWQGKGAWHFITVPKEASEEIKFFCESTQGKRRGWGAVRVAVLVGSTAWETSIFPQAKEGTYLLPVKAAVRKKEKMTIDQLVTVKLGVRV